MMGISRITVIGLTVIMFMLAGCSGTPVAMGSGNSNIDIENVDFTKGRTVSGSAGGFQLLLFIPININDRQSRAYQQLLAQAGGDYVTDIKVNESWTWGFVGTVHTTTIEGMAYPAKSTEQ